MKNPSGFSIVRNAQVRGIGQVLHEGVEVGFAFWLRQSIVDRLPVVSPGPEIADHRKGVADRVQTKLRRQRGLETFRNYKSVYATESSNS